MVLKYLVELYHEYQTAIVIMIGLTTVFISNNTISKKKKNYLFKIILFDLILMISENFTHGIITPKDKLIFLRITLDVIGYTVRPTLIVYFYLLIS